MDWFKSETSTSSLEYEVFKKKIEIIERMGDILEAKTTIDKYRLEGYYETQRLKQLIVATKPGSKADSDGARRSAELQEVMREGATQLTKALQESVKYRQNMLKESKHLQTQLESVISERDRRAENYSQALDSALRQFIQGVEHSYKTTQRNARRVTEQYLVLRHNARIASEILARSQNDAEKERDQLKHALVECQEVARQRVASAEESYQHELEARLQMLRVDVMHCEATLENKWQENADIRVGWKNTLGQLRKEIRYYKQKYEQLQTRRRHEITVIQGELSKLRDDISNAELVLLNPQHPLMEHLEETIRDTIHHSMHTSPIAARKGVKKGNRKDDVTRAESVMLDSLQRRVNELKVRLQEEEENFERVNDQEDPGGRKMSDVTQVH